ncbi:reverse transcriptase domain-containing protein, partial [Tanacetum coccineum]
HSGKTYVITAEKISVLTRGFWCIIPTTWEKGYSRKLRYETEVFQDIQLIQKLQDDQKCMKKVEHSSISKASKDIISIGSFMEVLVLNHYRRLFATVSIAGVVDDVVALAVAIAASLGHRKDDEMMKIDLAVASTTSLN